MQFKITTVWSEADSDVTEPIVVEAIVIDFEDKRLQRVSVEMPKGFVYDESQLKKALHGEYVQRLNCLRNLDETRKIIGKTISG